MISARANDPMREYANMGLQGVIEQASPHELVRLLMNGALQRIVHARWHLSEGNIARKAENLLKAIDMIETLRTSLDFERGAEIAGSLEALYEYMVRQLSRANAQNDVTLLSEVEDLLRQVFDGWSAIGQQATVATAR